MEAPAGVPILAKESPVWVAEVEAVPTDASTANGGRGGHGLRLYRLHVGHRHCRCIAQRQAPLAPAAALGSEVRPRCTAS